jgi:conjugative transfer pilus assembly protein TraH
VNKVIKGNIVWRVLKERNAGGWCQFGDDSLLEAIMSLEGTIHGPHRNWCRNARCYT